MKNDRNVPNNLPPYGTGIRDAVARNDMQGLRAHIGTVHLSLEELAKIDANLLANVADRALSNADISSLERALETIRKLLDKNA